MDTKVTALTGFNVMALNQVFADTEEVTTTATTATFVGMDAHQALSMLDRAMGNLPKASVRRSLHAVRRKLVRAL